MNITQHDIQQELRRNAAIGNIRPTLDAFCQLVAEPPVEHTETVAMIAVGYADANADAEDGVGFCRMAGPNMLIGSMVGDLLPNVMSSAGLLASPEKPWVMRPEAHVPSAISIFSLMLNGLVLAANGAAQALSSAALTDSEKMVAEAMVVQGAMLEACHASLVERTKDVILPETSKTVN